MRYNGENWADGDVPEGNNHEVKEETRETTIVNSRQFEEEARVLLMKKVMRMSMILPRIQMVKKTLKIISDTRKAVGEFILRQVFDSLEDFKKAGIDYTLKHQWNVKYVRWEKDKSELKCASEAEEGKEECLWKIYCAYEAPLQKYMVKTYRKVHSCSKTRFSKILTEDVIARLFVNDLRDNPKFMPKDIQREIEKRWNLVASIDQCRNAKRRALNMIQNEYDEQFSRLKDYRLELLHSNPGSTVDLATFPGEAGSDIFFRFYVCFATLKTTWCTYCRPIFGLDGCFLKCTSKGQLLAAVGRDANNQMYPIAWAVVDVENEENWKWFIQRLQTDLNLGDGEGFTVISVR